MANFLRIGTINVAVHSAVSAAERFASLGMPTTTNSIIELLDAPAQIRYFQHKVGESSISLVEPSDETSPIARFLTKRGEGVFSINIVVDDLLSLMDEWAAQGIRWVLKDPLVFEATDNRHHGGLVNWVSPDQIHGILLEFTQFEGL